MLDKPTTCQGCPAYTLGRGYVPGEGPTSAILALVGQGPGELEAHLARPFVGPSGDRLNSWLAGAKILRTRCYIDNAVRCWLPDNREPTATERTFCSRVHLLPDLQLLPQLKVVVTVGTVATKVFLPKAGEKTLGAAIPLEAPWNSTTAAVETAAKLSPQESSTNTITPETSMETSSTAAHRSSS